MSAQPRRIACLLGALWLACPAAAEPQRCRDDESVGQCWSRLFETVPSEASRETFEAEAVHENLERLFLKTTGLDGGDGELGTAVEDFLPLLAAAFDSGALGEDEAGLGIDVNNLLDLTHHSYKIQAVLHESETLFEPLQESLRLAGLDARASALEDDIDPIDDVSLVLVLSPVTEHLGRSHRRFSRTWSRLFEAVIDQVGEVASLEARAAGRNDEAYQDFLVEGYIPWFERHQEALGVDDLDEIETFGEIGDPVLRRDLQETVARLAVDERALERELAQKAEESRFFRFGDLIANQPQLTLRGVARIRDDLVGPDTYSIRLGYEQGFANVNDFRREECASADGVALLDCFRGYWERNQASIEAGDRLSAWVRYTRIDHYSFTSSPDDFQLRLDAEDRIEAEIVYGRYLDLPDFFGESEQTGATRFDLSGRYVGHLGDETRQDRLIATLVVTQRLLENFALAVDLSWANKPEFRSESGGELVAGIGVKYKLFSD